MFTGLVALSAWLFVFVLILFVPVQRKWQDDGDCRGIVVHTVRGMSNLERFVLWRSKIYLAEDVQ
jgi:hypothetical protein